MTGHHDAAQAAPQPGAALPCHAFAPGDEVGALCGETLGALHLSTSGVTCGDCQNILNACRCWSCDRQCGGDTGAGSCGPLADLDGRPVCEACREAADVIDTEHAGAKVTLSQERVRLRADVWNPAASSLWLDARSARHLGLVLIARAAELDLAELADAADDTPGIPGYSVIPRRSDVAVPQEVIGAADDSLCPVVGTIVARTEDPDYVMVAWGLGEGPARIALDELAPVRRGQ